MTACCSLSKIIFSRFLWDRYLSFGRFITININSSKIKVCIVGRMEDSPIFFYSNFKRFCHTSFIIFFFTITALFILLSPVEIATVTKHGIIVIPGCHFEKRYALLFRNLILTFITWPSTARFQSR